MAPKPATGAYRPVPETDDDVPSLEALPQAILLPPEPPVVAPPQTSEAATNRRQWFLLAIALGGLGVLVTGIAAGVGVMWLLSRPAERSMAKGPEAVQQQPVTAAAALPALPAPPLASTGATDVAAEQASTTQPLAANPPIGATPTIPSDPLAQAEPSQPPSTAAFAPLAAVAPSPGTTAAEVPAAEPVASAQTSSTSANLPTAAEPLPDDEPLDLASLLAVAGSPPPQPQCRTAQEREQYVKHVTSMLEAGLGPVRDRAREKASFDKAKALCATDPRLYYGYALILQKAEVDAALVQLKAAASEGAFPYPPAWRLHVHLLARKGLSPAAIQGLVTLGRRMEESNANWPDEAGKLEFAAFLGQTVGFLQGPAAEAKRFPVEIGQTHEQLLTVLQGKHREAYELAKAEVAATASELSESAEQAAEERLAAAVQQQQAAARENEEAQQKLEDDKQKLARTKEEYDQKWQQEKEKFEKDWTRLKADWDRLAASAMQVKNQISVIDTRIVGLQQQKAAREKLSSSKSGSDPLGNALEGHIYNALAERAFMRTQLMGIERQGSDVNVRAQLRLREMAQLEAQYQRATGQLVKESDLISGKRKLLESQSKSDARKIARKATASAARPEIKRLVTYAPLNVDAERDRILASYR